MAATIYYDKDADLGALKHKTVAVIGYGIQGRGQAMNLRDSGVKVIVAQRTGGPNYDQAVADGFTPVSAAEAAQKADVIILLAQDTLQRDLYRESIAPHLKPGKVLGFSHGFAIVYEQIVPPKTVDVIMIAPKGPGALVRTQFVEGKGVPALVAVDRDASGKALKIALAWAKGIGATRAGVIKTTFKEETETDHFGEQAVLCGGTAALIKAGFETLVEAGYQPEVAYFECLHELKLITDLIWAGGIQGMRRRVSDTAKWGDITIGPRVIDPRVKQTMRQVLREIQAGEFARKWISEHEGGRRNFTKLMELDEEHPVEQTGRKLRQMMAWIVNPKAAAAAAAAKAAVSSARAAKRAASSAARSTTKARQAPMARRRVD
jgi:ketol-acid reductoisomerase